MEVAQAVDNSGSAKRRKVGSGELRLSSSKSVRITGCDGEDVVISSKNVSDAVEMKEFCGDEICVNSGDILATCCSSKGSIMEKLKCADLEERSEIETAVRSNMDRRESLPLKQIKTHILSPNIMAGCFITPTSEFKEDSGEQESLTAEKPPAITDSGRTLPAAKTPPADELEDFFAAAEKDLQNRFKDKYNYDIVNDVPLKGRFDWVQLKP